MNAMKSFITVVLWSAFWAATLAGVFCVILEFANLWRIYGG